MDDLLTKVAQNQEDINRLNRALDNSVQALQRLQAQQEVAARRVVQAAEALAQQQQLVQGLGE